MRGEQIYLEARPILLIKKRCSRGRDSYSRGSFVSDLDDPAPQVFVSVSVELRDAH